MLGLRGTMMRSLAALWRRVGAHLIAPVAALLIAGLAPPAPAYSSAPTQPSLGWTQDQADAYSPQQLAQLGPLVGSAVIPVVSASKLRCINWSSTSTSGGFIYYYYTTTTGVTCTGGSASVDMIMCGAGGNGGGNSSNQGGGGGGGGECITAASFLLAPGSYSFSPGQPGVQTFNCSTGNGGNSTLGLPTAVTALGGGCGGSRTIVPTGGSAGQGWTGGPAGGAATIYGATVAARAPTAGTPAGFTSHATFNGGLNSNATSGAAAGGAGNGGQGGDQTGSGLNGAPGGLGFTWLDGITYGCGGGGASYTSGTPGAGGCASAGSGGISGSTPSAAAANLAGGGGGGGGGSGSNLNNGGLAGSGMFAIRVPV